MRQRRCDRGALTLASAEVKFEIDSETHDPLDIGMNICKAIGVRICIHKVLIALNS